MSLLTLRMLRWLLSLLALTTATHAAATFEGIEANRLREVIERAYNLEADVPELIAQLQRDHPQALAPEFIRVMRQYWMQNYAETDQELTAAFERDSLALIETARQRVRERPNDVDTACVAGLSQLIVGLYSVEKQRWWTALWKVRAGRNAMLKILEAHPDYADAKMAAGLADCYLDRTPGYLKPLTLLLGASGDMERGLQRLRDARDHGVITSVEAAYYLAGVQAELGRDPAAARDELAKLVARFPDNAFLPRLLGYFEMHSGRREQGRQRLAGVAAMPVVQAYPALGVRSQMWLCWDCMRTKDYAAALTAAEQAEAIVVREPKLAALRAETLTGQGEALKALNRIDEAFAKFEAVSPDFPEQRRRALDRITAIKKEIGQAE